MQRAASLQHASTTGLDRDMCFVEMFTNGEASTACNVNGYKAGLELNKVLVIPSTVVVSIVFCNKGETEPTPSRA